MSETRRRLLKKIEASIVLALSSSALLLTGGVEAVRAEAPEPVREETPLRVVPAMRDGAYEVSPRPENPREEAAPGVIVLNTRGYNYGPNRPTVMPTVAPNGAEPEPAAPDAVATD